MTIEVISIPDCPNHHPTVDRVKALLNAEGVFAEVREVLVDSVSDVRALRFIGSPTVRVNGKDVEPLAFAQAAMSCRIYEDGSGIPPENLLRRAIVSAAREEHA